LQYCDFQKYVNDRLDFFVTVYYYIQVIIYTNNQGKTSTGYRTGIASNPTCIKLIKSAHGKGEIMPNNQFKAVSMPVFLSDGSKKELNDFWLEKPLVLVFLRHFG